MPISIVSITFFAGLALIVIGVLGGGIEVKEIKIPTLPIIPRMLSFLIGSALLLLCLDRPDLLQVLSDNKIPSVSPPNPSPTVNSSPHESEPKRVEQEEGENLASAKFDETKLRTLAREAKTPKVRDEANRRLDVIATEQKSYEAVKNDIASLGEFVAKTCEACLMRKEGRRQLEKLNAARVEQEEGENLASAKFDETKLRTLAREAKTPKVRDEANRRLDVIATEQRRQLEKLNAAREEREAHRKDIISTEEKYPGSKYDTQDEGPSEKIKRCRIEVGGTTYLNSSPCVYSTSSDGRSFSIKSASTKYFARWHLETQRGRAHGYWNGPKAASQTSGDLGILKSNGACWENSTARICAWR